MLTQPPLARCSPWAWCSSNPVDSPARAPPTPRPCGPSCWPAPPPPRSVGRRASSCSQPLRLVLGMLDHRARAVDEQRAQVGVAALGQVPHASPCRPCRCAQAPAPGWPENSRPLRQALPSPSVAASAVAPSTPMPGTWRSVAALVELLLQLPPISRLELVDSTARCAQRGSCPSISRCIVAGTCRVDLRALLASAFRPDPLAPAAAPRRTRRAARAAR